MLSWRAWSSWDMNLIHTISHYIILRMAYSYDNLILDREYERLDPWYEVSKCPLSLNKRKSKKILLRKGSSSLSPIRGKSLWTYPNISEMIIVRIIDFVLRIWTSNSLKISQVIYQNQIQKAYVGSKMIFHFKRWSLFSLSILFLSDCKLMLSREGDDISAARDVRSERERHVRRHPSPSLSRFYFSSSDDFHDVSVCTLRFKTRSSFGERFDRLAIFCTERSTSRREKDFGSRNDRLIELFLQRICFRHIRYVSSGSLSYDMKIVRRISSSWRCQSRMSSIMWWNANTWFEFLWTWKRSDCLDDELSFSFHGCSKSRWCERIRCSTRDGIRISVRLYKKRWVVRLITDDCRAR